MDPFTQELLRTFGALLAGVLIGALYGYASGLERARTEQRNRRARAGKDSRRAS